MGTNKQEGNYCTVEECNILRFRGDLLFYPTCRKEWIDLLRKKNLHETVLGKFTERKYLKQFRRMNKGARKNEN